MRTALLLFFVVFAFYLPVHMLRRELAAKQRPDYWRRWGAVVVRPAALELREQLIGYYMGVEIFERIRFHQLDYRFSRIGGPREREAIDGGELYLEPGLIYRLAEVDCRSTSR